MHLKKELCRNFQRGGCQYGERCKFIHATQQQGRPNAFGFGTQSGSLQQQKTNPYGFGVQNSSHPRAAAVFGSKHNQYKPFENTWNRFSPIANAAASSSQQSDRHSQSGNHKCTDPGSCKRQIEEDFQHERPLWKLTCYSHWKYASCDIGGDISYEELRAAAYDDAKRGLNLQSIVERERNTLNFKLAEFENFLCNPYVSPSSSTTTHGVQLGSGTNMFPFTSQNSSRPAVSSLSPLHALTNTGGSSPYMQSNAAFGSLNSSSTSSLTIDAFGKSNTSSGSVDQHKMLNSANNHSDIYVEREAADAQQKSKIQQQREYESKDASIWLKEKWSQGEIPEEAPPDAFIK